MEKNKGPTLVVLAAGMGSRFGGLKQLEPLSEDGNILIEYLVFDAIRAGFDKVVFIVRRSFIEDFEKLVEGLAKHVTVEYAFQDEYEPAGIDLPDREKPWGTGHALLAAEHLIAEPMAVINADDYYGQSAYATAVEFLSKQANDSKHYGMLGYVLRSVLSDHGPFHEVSASWLTTASCHPSSNTPRYLIMTARFPPKMAMAKKLSCPKRNLLQ